MFTKEEKKDRTNVGCLAFSLMFAAGVIASIAFGVMFGVQWGLIALAAFLMLLSVYFYCLLAIDKKLHLEKRSSESDNRKTV